LSERCGSDTDKRDDKKRCGQHDLDEIPVLLKPVIEAGYNLAAGSRKQKESKRKGKRPFIRPAGQFVLRVSLGTLTKKRYSDPECGFRALSRRTRG